MLNAPTGGALAQTGQVDTSVPATTDETRCWLCPLPRCEYPGCRNKADGGHG
jgi:hypothetical protein